MATTLQGRAGDTARGGDHLPGYAECHFCTVGKKRRSWRCVRCVGRAGLRERILRAAEEKTRRRAATVLSFLFPGLGHLYRSSPGTGLFFFMVIGIVVSYFTLVKGGLGEEFWSHITSGRLSLDDMTSGRWFLVGSLAVVWIAQALDAGRGPGERTPPCQEACPAGVACMRYVNLTREGKNREALELVQVSCPFPGTVGRVCHHPCEQNCRRGVEGEPIAICAIKRYLSDNASGEAEGFFPSEGGGAFKEKVAVVGGGPSGLSAALYLRLAGFEVTVFEAGDQLGGMPQAVIPEYRLPAWVFREEIERVLSLGVEVRKGMRFGDAFGLKDLKEQGFAAVYLAMGAQRTVRLPHCGTPEEGFLDGLEFLRASKAGTQERLHGNVLVIGGGNVAVDVAKTAVRMGGAKVRKIFLETRETMPAHVWECEEAIEEGVRLIPAAATVSFEKAGGRVSRALCKRVERIDVDENKRIRPVLAEGTEFALDVDWVVTAVGTFPDWGAFGKRPEMKPLRPKTRAGRLPAGQGPGIPVVVGGDLFAGPASVIDAVAAGYQASLEITRALGKTAFFRLPLWNRMRRIKYPNYMDSSEKAVRKHPVKVAPEVRCGSFCEVCESYNDVVAADEASRCMRCSWPMRPPPKREVAGMVLPSGLPRPRGADGMGGAAG